jgi:hypothetical protein
MARYYYDSSKGETAPEIIDGNPPIDQSALVAQLQAENAALVQQVAALNAKLAVGRTEAQQTVDALA